MFSAGFLGGILDKSHVHVKAKSRVRFRGEIIFPTKVGHLYGVLGDIIFPVLMSI